MPDWPMSIPFYPISTTSISMYAAIQLRSQLETIFLRTCSGDSTGLGHIMSEFDGHKRTHDEAVVSPWTWLQRLRNGVFYTSGRNRTANSPALGVGNVVHRR